jgi:hypothetical protein
MSAPLVNTYTVYLPPLSEVIFPVEVVTLTPPQSQEWAIVQVTGQIQSTEDAKTALGLGTSSAVATKVVAQNGETNIITELLLNLNGEANGETGGDIPPRGVLALTHSFCGPLDQLIPLVIVGSVATALSTDSYQGAQGLYRLTRYADGVTPAKLEVVYTLPRQRLALQVLINLIQNGTIKDAIQKVLERFPNIDLSNLPEVLEAIKAYIEAGGMLPPAVVERIMAFLDEAMKEFLANHPNINDSNIDEFMAFVKELLKKIIERVIENNAM